MIGPEIKARTILAYAYDPCAWTVNTIARDLEVSRGDVEAVVLTLEHAKHVRRDERGRLTITRAGWAVLNPGHEKGRGAKGESRAAVLLTLRRHGTMALSDLAETCGLPIETVRWQCRMLANEGRAESVKQASNSRRGKTLWRLR